MATNVRAVDFGQGIEDAWSDVASFVPKFIAFLVILLIGWIIAKALAKIVDTVLERVGFDRVLERSGLQQFLARSTYDASDFIAKLVYYAVLLIALQVAAGVFGPNPISDLLDGVVAFLPKAIVAIIIVIVAAAIARAVKDIVENALSGLAYGRLLSTVTAAFIIGLGVIAALNQIGVATTVTTPVLIAVLATLGGILVVGVGGGLVRPMTARWEQWIAGIERESAGFREQRQRQSSADSSGQQGYPTEQGYSGDYQGGI